MDAELVREGARVSTRHSRLPAPARDAFQLPLGKLVYGDLSPLAQGTRFGTAFIAMTLGFALVAAILFLA